MSNEPRSESANDALGQSAYPGMLIDLSERERDLIDASRRGDILTCSDLDPDRLRGSTNPDHVIRGAVLRELLMGRHRELDPRGVRVVRARITGKVDLNHVNAAVGLQLDGCVLDEPAQLRDGHLPWMYLIGTHLPALHASGLRVDGDLVLRDGCEAFGHDAKGAVRLLGAHIGRDLELSGVRLTNTAGPALHADQLRVGRSLVLRDGCEAFGHGAKGAVRLLGTSIGGDLELSGARLTNTAGPALHADKLQVDGSLSVREECELTVDSELGCIRLLGASIGGDLELSGARLTNTAGPALHADKLQVDGSLSVREECELSSDSELGCIRLLAARIGSSLALIGARLTNTAGPALLADGLRVDGSLSVREECELSSDGELGCIRLLGAQIGGDLALIGGRLTNTAGPALEADRLRVDGGLFLRDGLKAYGHGEPGCIRLLGAHISRNLDLSGALLDNSGGDLLLDLENVRCSTVFMSAKLVCPGGRRTGRACPDAGRRLDINGFSYIELGHVGWERWLHLMRCHTQFYWPVAYQQLAAVRTAAGHDRDARRILITQQQDHRARGDVGGPLRRAVHLVWGGLAGYGYRTGRTALALLTVLLLAGGMGWWAGHTQTAPGRYAAEHPTPPTSTPAPSGAAAKTAVPGSCSPVELIGLGIDRGLPLATTGIRARCDLDTASPAGQWFTVAIWLLQALVWALATLAVAGYTGLIRKIR